MRVAALVLAQQAPRVLAAVAAYFAPSDVDLYVHVDAKSDLEDYLAKSGPLPPRLRLLENRRRVYWAGFSMLEATFDLLRAALHEGPYDRYLFITDDSLPVQPLEGLFARLAAEEDIIACQRVPEGDAGRSRYEENHLIDGDVFDCRRHHIPPQAVGEETARQLESLLAIRRRGKRALDLYYGHACWALAHDSARLALETVENDPWLVESCRFAAFSDEFLIQSIVGAAKYPNGRTDGPVYADFFRHQPRTLRSAVDLPFDMHPNFLFLRKIAPDFEPGLPETCLRLYGGLRAMLARDPEMQQERALLLGVGATCHIHLFAPADEDPDWSRLVNRWGRRARWTRADVCRWRLRAPQTWAHVIVNLTCVAIKTDAVAAQSFLQIGEARAPLTPTDMGYRAEFQELAQPFDTIELHSPSGDAAGDDDRRTLSIAAMPRA